MSTIRSVASDDLSASGGAGDLEVPHVKVTIIITPSDTPDKSTEDTRPNSEGQLEIGIGTSDTETSASDTRISHSSLPRITIPDSEESPGGSPKTADSGHLSPDRYTFEYAVQRYEDWISTTPAKKTDYDALVQLYHELKGDPETLTKAANARMTASTNSPSFDDADTFTSFRKDLSEGIPAGKVKKWREELLDIFDIESD